jgi:hypothetical protein
MREKKIAKAKGPTTKKRSGVIPIALESWTLPGTVAVSAGEWPHHHSLALVAIVGVRNSRDVDITNYT